MLYQFVSVFVSLSKVRFKYRFYPTLEQERHLACVFGCVRFTYNWALQLRTDAYRNGTSLNYNATSAALTQLKKQQEMAWLNEVSCVPTQQSLRHLQIAFKNFFDKRATYPTFKKRRGKQSAEYTRSAFKYEAQSNALSVSGLGKLKVRWSRTFESSPTTITITKDCCGRYFVTLCLEESFEELAKTGQNIGVDLGINRLATLSNGERIANPKHSNRRRRELAHQSRHLARKTKGSKRWEKQRLKVARVHARIADTREDYLHKVTTDLVRRFDLICMEDLNMRGLVKNHKLARSLCDASFGMFRSMLQYKCTRYGKEWVAIDRFFPSSKMCSACGVVKGSLPLDVRQWTCECGVRHDRDLNAAQNIVAVGHTVNARGGSVRRELTSVDSRATL